MEGAGRRLAQQLEQFIIPALEETGKSLGHGAYGEVVKMKMNGEAVAVKKVHDVFLRVEGADNYLAKFEEECVRLSEINHSNIVAFRGIYYEGNSPVPMLVMEYVPDCLRKYLEDKNQLSEVQTTNVFMGITQGLKYMHELDPPLIHRDLTSSNILLTKELEAKIADLGVSKLLNREALAKMTNVPGNEAHMPPEARLTDKQSYAMVKPSIAIKLDVFSFGNIMINVLTKEFPAATAERDENGRRKNEVQRRSAQLEKIPEGKQKDLIVRCLNNNPDHRPTSNELVQIFEGSYAEEDDNIAIYDDEPCFVDPPSYDVTCPVCYEVLENAHQTKCCGNHICPKCSERLNVCSFCRSSNPEINPDKFFSRQVMSLMVECYNSKRGCPWTGELRELKQHMEVSCKKNFIHCRHCSFECARKEFPGHPPACTEAPQPCPNHCPLKTIKRKDLKQHLESECPLRSMQISPAMSRAANNSAQTAPLALTMTNYLQHKQAADAWYSPPFYTHKNGYKVRLRVDANLRKKGFVSVVVCMMKGKHDEALPWPALVKLEVALYNWRSNQPLYTKVLHLLGDIFCSRVTTDLPASWGQGEIEFIAHDSLAYSAENNTEYVQHDCLNFAVKKAVLVRPPVKPKLPQWATGSCFVVPFFAHMKNNNLRFYGPSFFTHEKGYKLCPRVDPGGFGAGKGSHVSVSCTLMKGEHDNQLRWPILADVTLKMLNWRENKGHQSYTVALNEASDNKARARVLPTNAIADLSWGSPTFASHSSLSHNAKTNTQYLRDGCILIKVESFAAYMDKNLATRLPKWATGIPHLGFTLSEFAKRKVLNNAWYSPPFFSHKNGYKMRLCVYAAKGNYIGVYVHLVKGPNDNLLQWPFHGDVVLELANWQANENHHQKVITFSFRCTNAACARIPIGQEQGPNWGHDDFISHAALPSDPQTGTEYLQNDCLHFKVKEVVVHSIPTLYSLPRWQDRRSIMPSHQFTINNFTKRKAMKGQYFGPAFSTHRGGYRVRLEVELNEDEKIAVYARVLRGENDAALDWPLHANIIIELLNWQQNSNHRTHNIQLHGRVPSKYRNRSFKDEASASWGTGSFISHDKLSQESSIAQYLQNDCLCIRIGTVKTYSTRLDRKVPRWQPPNAPASFTIADVIERAQASNIYFTPPFIAANYKMCLRVEFGDIQGYISVYGCLLKGDNDDRLEWPFRGDVIVEALNWQKDAGHHKKILSMEQNPQPRVTEDITLPGGYGKSKFMPIPNHGSQYLDEGCIRLRVTDIILFNHSLQSKKPHWQNWTNTSSSWLMEFTVTNIVHRFHNDLTAYSPPFFSHRGGYKLRLEVETKGEKGYLSIYSRLLAGENDTGLKWPMNIELTVEVVNWKSNSNHILKRISWGSAPASERSRVPKEKAKADSQWGLPKFCSHAELFNGPPHIKYVEDDCIRVRVKGALIRSRKSFLGL